MPQSSAYSSSTTCAGPLGTDWNFRRELQRVVSEFKTQNSNNNTAVIGSASAVCSWQTIEDMLQQAESDYNQVSFARRALRGQGPANVASLVEAIPEDEGLGVLKAGILILINVCMSVEESVADRIIYEASDTTYMCAGNEKTNTGVQDHY